MPERDQEPQQRPGMESNAESQRKRSMSSDERGRIAVETVTKNLYDQAQKNGERMSWDQAHRHVEGIAEREKRKKNK
jgi:hypothetical protein